MKNLFTNFSKFAPDNGSGMHRLWTDNGPIKSRKLFALLFCLLFVRVGNAWGAEGDTHYTLQMSDYYSGTKPSGYESTGNVVFGTSSNQKTWNIPGNATLGSFFGIGGKNTTNTVRTMYSVSSIGTTTIGKVRVTTGGTGGKGTITFSQLVLEVSSNSDFAKEHIIDTKTNNSPAINNTNDFTPTAPLTSWPAGSYYRFKYTYKNSQSSNNGYFKVNSITFYEGAPECTGTTLDAPEVSVVPSSNRLTLSWPNDANADSYTVTCKVKSTGVNAGSIGAVTGTDTKTCAITTLTNGTEYTWSVTANGDGTTYCTSDATEGSMLAGTSYTVTWMVNGESYETTYVYSGGNKNLVFPTAPSSCDAKKVFVGWTTTNIGSSETDTPPAFVTSGTTISSNQTYYAVFAKRGRFNRITGPTSLSAGQLIVITGNKYSSVITNGIGYASPPTEQSDTLTSASTTEAMMWLLTGNSSNGWTISKIDNGYLLGYASNPGSNSSTPATLASYNTKSTWKIGQNSYTSNVLYISNWSSNQCALEPPSAGANWVVYNTSSYSSNQYTALKVYASTLTKFVTQCCTQLGSINGSVSWSNPTQAMVTWDKLDDKVSAWALSWSPNTAGSSITSAIADKGSTQKTATVSGLACGTEYTFTLTPTLKSGVCTPASNPTIESTSTKYSITKASVTGGSFTTKISSTAVTEACNSSTISIAATPSTGYTFSSWMITNDDNSDADVTSTLLGANSTTASTSFTMPSHRVTITPSFSCIEPEIGTDPASASYTEGASPSALTVAATLSSGTLTYKWQKSTNSGVSWTDESGTGYNTETYAAANISTSLSANGVQYRCIVGNSEGGCTVTSGVATITVTAASKCVAPTFDPVAGTYNSSQTVTISSSTSGSTIYYTTNGSTPTTSSSHGTEGEASASVTVSSSLTLKAIAYKGGMTTSDVSDAAYVICSTDPSFSTTSSSNITITGARVTCAGITKGTCDIDAYGIVYGTSEHPTGNAQQKGTDASTNVSSYYVDLTGLTAATTYYARPYATVNGKTVYGTEISFTTLHIPVITVSETSRAFGTKKVDGSYEMSFTVSGSYLQSNIGLAISGTNEAMFSVDKTSLTPSTGTVGSTTVTVTYTPSAAGSHSATVSITSTNATTKTVTLSGTGQYEDTYMTAMHEGVDAWEDYATGVTKAGTGYDVPNPGDIAAGDREGTGCEGIHYHFAGWVEETYKASPSGHIVAASGTKDASNKTFWAVWEKEKAGSGIGYTQTTTVSAGDVVVIAEIDDAASEKTGRELSGFSSTTTVYGLYSDFATTPAGTIEWTVEEGYNSKGVAFKNSSDEYLYLASAANSLSTSDSKSAQSSWSVTTDSERAKIVNNNWDTRIICWNGGSPRFACYASKDHGDEVSGSTGKYYYYPIFYKKNTISYEDPKVECVCSANPSAGTAAVDAEGTFSASSIAVKATSASTGHADCSYTDYGFVWSSSVTTPTLVEATGAASTNCTKVPVGNDGQVTSFTGSISGSFTANTPIYVRSYVKNGKAEGTYQYSDVVTITPRSVTFNLNGHGSSTPATQFVNNGSKATDPSYAESVTGYTFGGWYKEVGCTNQWNFASDVVSGESKTLYAKWTPISYSVRFNDNDENYLGDATGSMSNQSFDYDESKALTANGFSLAGYDFAGWALTADGSVAHSDEAVVGNLSSTDGATVDLYAIWSPKNYDVTLAATNETSSVGEQVVTATYNAAMPTTKKGSGDVVAPSRTGYTFTGWEYSSTTYYNYDAGTSTLSSAHVWNQPNSTTTLTPKWSINSYTLTWDLAGGTVSVAGTGAEAGATGTQSSSVVYYSDITVPTVTKAGYNFAGWDVTPASKMPASNVTYTATWTAKTLNSISLAEASVSVYVGEIKYVNVIFDPTDILSKAFSQSATPIYCQLNSYDSYNKLKITGGRAGADISVNRTETVSIKYTADETKTASISVTVKPLPTVTFVDLIHNKSDFTNSGDGWTAGTGVLSSTAAAGVVSHSKKTPTHADLAEPATGNACEKGHLHLVGWIRSDFSKVVDYLDGTGAAPSISDLTTAGATYWFLPDASINVETLNGKMFYAVWAVEE